MATVNVPGQNFSYWVPDNGEVFKNSQGALYYREGNAVNQVYTDAVKATGMSPDGYLQSIGVDPSKVTTASDMQMADLLGYTTRGQSGLTFGTGGIDGLTAFAKKNIAPTPGEVITFAPSSSNPHAAVITSNHSGVISDPVADGTAPKTPGPGAIAFDPMGKNPNAAALANGGMGGYQAPAGPKPVAPVVAPGSSTAAPANTTIQPPAPASTPTYQPPAALNSTLPGGNATNLYDYYGAKGASLPSVTDRGALFQQLGLGTAGTYKGTAAQNEALLQKLQLKDHSSSAFGGGTSSSTTGTDQTAAGVSLSQALGGKTADETLSNYRTYLASALGTSEKALNTAEANVESFYSTRKSAEQILNEELDRRGVTQSQSLLSDLDKEIRTQQSLLDKLPENIRTTLSDVGVSQAQLERLQLKESAKPAAILKDLLTSRNALASDINTAVSFAEKFADTRIADQAAKLAALQWEVNNDQKKYADLSSDAKALINKSIDEKKDIFDIAKTAAEHGATSKQIDGILASTSKENALTTAGHLMVTPKTTSSTTVITKDIKDAGTALELGMPDKGYNGRGPDGFVDPNLYVALYNQAHSLYGNAGAAAFLDKYPPKTHINPANVGTGSLPTAIENAVQAGKKKSAITIDPATIQAALNQH